ncbi:MAG: hypothetical protein FJ118_12730 [Deltaproteobacteria bacterium]|nr:hypothetical protein [Deltaproteobacteria bacterium]
MGDFVSSVLASVLGGLILLLVTIFVSRKVRGVFMGIFGRILDVDIDAVYRNKKESEEHVRKEVDKARWIKVFTGRGNELQRDTFKSIFGKNSFDKTFTAQILLPQTRNPGGRYDWLAQREKELCTFDPSYCDGSLRSQIDTNCDLLLSHAEHASINLKRYNVPDIGRIIVTDRCLIFTPYRDDAYARDCKVYIFRKQDEMYDNLHRFFDLVWEASDEAEL